MSVASIIDGKAIAADVRGVVACKASKLKALHGIRPGLAVILVGDDPASQVYVRNKIKFSQQAGLASFEYRLAPDVSERELLELIERLNQRADVHGILVQLPLPDHIDEQNILLAIDPGKDVDGFHPLNVGALVTGGPGLRPCTPQGCVLLAQSVTPDLAGMNAVIVGRSNIVGKPLAHLLLQQNCTVTIAHSRTRNLPDVTRQADLLIAAVGRAGLIRGDQVREGAIVIDVGINRVAAPEKGNGKTRLVGDVAFDEALPHARAITPVPGGVGPMTIACLLQNTVQAAAALNGLELPQCEADN